MPNTYTITLWDLATWQEVDVVVDERLAKKPDGTGRGRRRRGGGARLLEVAGPQLAVL